MGNSQLQILQPLNLYIPNIKAVHHIMARLWSLRVSVKVLKKIRLFRGQGRMFKILQLMETRIIHVKYGRSFSNGILMAGKKED